jgi:hypothetical protein
MPSKLVSIHRPLVNPELFRPVTDEIIRRYGRAAITPFTGANVFMNIARRADLAKIPEWPDNNPSPFHNLLRSVLPPSFGKAPLTARVARYREVPTGTGRVLFAQFTPNKDLVAEHSSIDTLLQELGIKTQNKYPFRYQVGVGMVYEQFSDAYRAQLLRESPRVAAFDAGKILINNVSKTEAE